MNKLRDQLVSTFKEQMDIRLDEDKACTQCGRILFVTDSISSAVDYLRQWNYSLS